LFYEKKFANFKKISYICKKKINAMKKTIIILATTIIILLPSCKKNEFDIEDPKAQTQPQPNSPTMLQGKWLITDGYIYITDMKTGQKTYYSHFSKDGDTSSLRYGGYYYEIEMIIKNKTTWEFQMPSSIPGYGKFILNNNPQYYETFITSTNISIIDDESQRMGGSAFPIRIENANEQNITITAYDGYYLKEDIAYHSKLILSKQN
jgi:hypothetical protein